MITRFDELLTQTKDTTKAAICHKDSYWSYAQMFMHVQSQARALQGIGLKKQQRVAIYLPKQIETVTSFFAVSLAGGVVVPVNSVLKTLQVCHILKDCAASILITSLSRFQGLADFLKICGSLHSIILVEDSLTDYVSQTTMVIIWSDFLASGLALSDFVESSSLETDMAAILYTSGSTGNPKGVVLSHRNVIAGAESVAHYLQLSAKDRLLAVLPFSFDYGLNQLMAALYVGGSCVLLDYLVPNDVIRALVEYEITGLAAVPPLWIQLATLHWPISINQHLRYMTNSGGKLPVNVLEKICQNVPDSQFYLMYGLTEAFRSTYLPPEQRHLRPESIGKAIPNAEILVVRADGSLCDVDEPGELVHRGPLVSLGYWNDPAATALRFKPAPGQLKELPLPEIAVWSGDMVRRDAEGYLYFIGRNDEMIKTSGYRVSPTEVEEVIYATGMVKEVVALGVPHQTLGHAIMLVVSVDSVESFDSNRLLIECKQQLPNYMLPHRIKVVTALPRNPNGKIDRNLLKQQFIVDILND